MNSFILRKISHSHLPVLDNMLQLYAHELNEYFNYSISMNNDGRYRIKSAEKHLADGWGYFILVSGEYAGFILLNHNTITDDGTAVPEFFMLPRYRKGLFYRDVIASLLTTLDGIVEYSILKKNMRALFLFDDLAKKFLSHVQRIEEHVDGSEFFRYIFDIADLTCDIEKYKKYVHS